VTARDDVLAAIADARGPIPFVDVMALALYGEHGFYTAGTGSAGRRGDFLTSPEVGPLFGAVVARLLDAEWERLGRPDPFTFVDAGAGPGTLARAVIAAGPACAGAMRYVAVERSAAQRARHPEGVTSSPVLPPGPITGVIVANELLDNLPFRLVVFDGHWRESLVADDGQDGFVEVLSAPLEPRPAVLPAHAPLGARAPLQEIAVGWASDVIGRTAAGSLLVFDYARPTTAEFATTPWRQWLRTYRGHHRGGHYLRYLGEQDVTSDVALDQLPPPTSVSTQADFLHAAGMDELVDDGRRAWRAGAGHPDLAALTMRSRAGEADALLDPGGLGAFTVAMWRF